MIRTNLFFVEGDVVRWNTDGTKFAIICGSTVTVYGIVSFYNFIPLTSADHKTHQN